MAAWYLKGKGVEILARNVTVPGGEIDLVGLDGPVKVAVEIRTRIGGPDPAEAADRMKREHAGRLARRAGARRFDILGIRLDCDGFDIHWVPDAS